MKQKSRFSLCRYILISIILYISYFAGNAQSIEEWYASAQERIDTLRKGSFGVKILDKNGQPYSGEISVQMAKHEFPFGIAFDLYEGAVFNGNAYNTATSVRAIVDAEIYQSERWYSYMTYAIPVEIGRNYKLTLKFAEIYFSTAGSRIFDVSVEGSKFLQNFDVYAAAGSNNLAIDTSIDITAADDVINIELLAKVDNAAIKGIEIQSAEGDWITRINCGGGAITTTDGNYYENDEKYFDLNTPRLPSQEDWMKATMQKYFNYGVSGNSFKWSGIQPQHTKPNYTNFDHAVEWTQSIGWELRAHTLLWGGNDDHSMPAWVRNLPSPQAITDTCKMRVIREMTRYKGIVKEYDVINEPLTGHADYLQSVVGDSINWNCFKWAHSADPNAEVFINDYNVEYNWGQAEEYRDLILKILEMGGPVTGAGMQAHFWENMRPKLTEFVTNINIVAEAGLPIKLTEFDNGPLNQQDQADDMAMVLKIAFSHPAINGIVSWALRDGNVWREGTGIFEANNKPKLAADTLWYYTKELWATNFDTVVASNSEIIFNAYYGNYDLEVKFGDTIKIFNIPCIKANEDSIFVLNENQAVIKGPELISAQLISDTSLTLIFDKPIQSESILNGNFKFFSKNLLQIQNINVDVNNSKALIIFLKGMITPNDYLSVSYFPGSFSSMDGGKSAAFGPETVNNLTTGLLSAEVTNDGNNIEVTFSNGLKNLSENLTSFSILDNNQPITINTFDFNANDSNVVIFAVTPHLTSNSKPTIQYTQGTLQSVDNFKCRSSEIISVTNKWPNLVSAEVNKTGNRIVALFQAKLQNVTENINAFTIEVDDQPIEISSISEAGLDSSKLTFIITDIINEGQNVTLSYEPGSIKGLNGNSLAQIDNIAVTNNSTQISEGIDEIIAGKALIYPNPACDEINISSNSVISSISIFNNIGDLVYKSQCNSEIITVDISKLYGGIYLIQVFDVNGNTTIEKLILK